MFASTLISFIFALLLFIINCSLASQSYAQFGLPEIPKSLVDFAGNKSESKSNSQNSGESNSRLSLVSTAFSTQGLDEEIAAGDAVAALYLGAAPLIENEKVNSYLQSLGHYISDQTERADLPWAFGLIDSPTVNAFAAPGGKVLITSGLFNMLNTEDELAAVLGHEIAHIVLKHHWEIIKKQKLVSGFVDIATSNVDSDSSASAAVFNALEDIIRNSIISGIDRSGEFEADIHGIRYAAIAGYNVTSVFGVLDSLSERAAKSNTDVNFLYKTHPTAEKRTNELTEILSLNPILEDYSEDSYYAERILYYQSLLDPSGSATDKKDNSSMFTNHSYCGICNVR